MLHISLGYNPDSLLGKMSYLCYSSTNLNTQYGLEIPCIKHVRITLLVSV